MSTFKGWAQKVPETPFIIPVYFVLWFAFYLSVRLGIEDYWTSYRGYEGWPTAKATDVVWAVAFLPQVAQIVFGYAAMELVDLRERSDDVAVWYLSAFSPWIAFTAAIVDIATDTYYKIDGNVNLIPAAILESVTIFTLFSELLFVTSLGMALTLTPKFLQQCGRLLSAIMPEMPDKKPGGGQQSGRKRN